MTPQELDRKLHILACAALGLDDEDHESDEQALPLETAITQLIRDCIEAVTPGHVFGEDEEAWAYDRALDDLEANTKELLDHGR